MTVVQKTPQRALRLEHENHILNKPNKKIVSRKAQTCPVVPASKFGSSTVKTYLPKSQNIEKSPLLFIY